MGNNATDEWNNNTGLTDYGWWSDLAAVDGPGDLLNANHLHRLPAWLDTLRLGSHGRSVRGGRGVPYQRGWQDLEERVQCTSRFDGYTSTRSSPLWWAEI